MELTQKGKKLQGPILILGGSGFIGANLLRTLLKVRDDVIGTTTHLPFWRLEGVPEKNIVMTDLLVDANLDALLRTVKPRTIFNCAAYGSYSFETDAELIYQTNFMFPAKLLERLNSDKSCIYIHAGSSSEYGDNSAGPDERDWMAPNSEYAVSKAATAHLIHYFGKKHRLPCINLRLYSVYGPLEDSSRLIPTLIRYALEGRYPELVDPEISRDFVYIDDVCEAFIDAAIKIEDDLYGESFNIGSGRKTTIREIASTVGDVFNLSSGPVFSLMANRKWDLSDWYGNVQKAKQSLGWQAARDFREGLVLTAEWYRSLEDKERYHESSKKYALDTRHSVSAIVACYKDSQAIPVLYDRLKATFSKLKIDYEIIFVNDGSPDDSEEIIRGISRKDRRVVGISHSRNFGSQAAFRSGMDIASKNACVLLDGDLQDPPDLIEQFVPKWREGYDVVYGRRRKRIAPLHMQIAYKLFYRMFDYFSYIPIPHDAGDFSLMDKRVVKWILRFPERDLFLRGVRAFAGFKQTGVDYDRPERMFGSSTNSILRNIGWAKKGIFSFSKSPLNMLSFLGTALFFLTVFLGSLQILTRLFFPELVPKGITTVLLTILFFGSLNLLGIAILGEYIGKIFDEVKRRPHFIRQSIIRNGEIRPAMDSETIER